MDARAGKKAGPATFREAYIDVATVNKRNALKASLWETHPRCAVCDEPLPGTCDMHECIVPKRIAAGWSKKQRWLINHRYNCVLVHSGTGCHLWAHAHPRIMVAQLIVQYTWEGLDEWVGSLPFKVPYSWHRGILSWDEAMEVLGEARA